MSAPHRVQRLSVRAMQDSDAIDVGELLRSAFGGVYAQHGFPTPFPNLDGAAWLASAYLALDRPGAFVADQGGTVVGCGFVHVRGQTASIGPVAALPSAPHGVGRAIMDQLLRIAGDRSTRLFQDAFNPESFALYCKLGFASIEPIAYVIADSMAGGVRSPECGVLGDHDFDDILELDSRLTGAHRAADLREIMLFGTGLALRRGGKLCGFLLARRGASRLVVAPAVAERPEDLRTIISDLAYRYAGQGAAARIPAGTLLGAGGSVLAAALGHGFRIEHLGHLMVRGGYPANPGAQLLSIFPESL